jgi:hypothetical protein
VTAITNVVVGSFLVVAASYENGSATPTMADSLGNTFSRDVIVANLAGTPERTVIFSSTAAFGGADTFTLTSAGASFVTVSFTEVQNGTWTSVDATATVNNALNTSITTTAANDLVFAAFGGNQSSSTGSVVAPLQLISFTTGNGSADVFIWGAHIPGAAGTYAYGVISNDNSPCIAVVAYK